ncbi:MAG TPA: hypothetical protein VFO72_03830, partial [Pyrinomonadaceae bacterium]|nr:hypothetical protein [Pyrinomonadaceae bacterium]
GPGTPYFEDAPALFSTALAQIDFAHDPAAAQDALTWVLNQARPRDTLTLWHLLSRVNEAERVRVYEALTKFVPPPAGVTREGVLQLNKEMLERWKVELEASWGWRGKLDLKKLLKKNAYVPER